MNDNKAKLIFVADFFLSDIIGGGEIHNEELITILSDTFEYDVEKVHSHMVDVAFLKRNKDNKFIIGNFLRLSTASRKQLMEMDYVIYEHDHKYLKNRNPAGYKNFKAPADDIVNYEFYNSAKAIFCQSGFHKKIVEGNLNLSNIKNASGNLWSPKILSHISSLGRKDKKDIVSIMSSPIHHKNTTDAVRYCQAKGYEYELIPPLGYKDFLDRVSNNKHFVFFPKTPETLSRIVVEARMMSMSVTTNNLVGATKEPWYNFKGQQLVEYVHTMRTSIPEKVIEALDQ
jgi:hypothetical protein